MRKPILTLASLLVLFALGHSVHSEESSDEEIVDNGEDTSAPTGTADYREKNLSAGHRIARVTVYSDRADITRSAQVAVKPGTQWIHFASLPENLDRKSLRVQLAKGVSGKIKQVITEDAFETLARPADLEKKLTQLRSWYGELLGMMQDEDATNDYLAFVQNLKFDAPFKREVASQAYRSFSAKVDSLKSSMDEIQTQSGKLATKLHDVREKKRSTQEKVDHVLKEIQEVTQKNERKWMVHVYAQVDSPKAGTIPMEVTYQIANAKWHPLYDVRSELDRSTGTAAIRLVTTALVEQHTGEDWKGVQLTLSTLDPVPLYLPKMNRWVLSEVRSEAPPEPRDGVTRNFRMGESGGGGGVRGKGYAAAESAPVQAQEAFADQTTSVASAPAPAAGMATPQKSAMRNVAPKPLSKKKRRQSKEEEAEKRMAADDADMNSDPKVSSSENRFPMRPLEEIFPQIATADQQLSSFKQTSEKRRVFEAAKIASAPQPISYQDSSLPAPQAGGHLIEFASPFPIDLKSDERALKTPVHSQLLTGQLTYFAIPKKDNRVFLRAKTTNTTDSPILGGAAQVFMDGDLVSTTSIETLSPDSYFMLDLGTDRNVETKRTVKKQAKKTGIISKSHVTDVGVKIELANHHPFPVKMEVKDNYPQSPGQQIEVELDKMTPKPTDKDDGLLTWDVVVPAKQKTMLSFSYRVTHPENYIVSELDQ